MTGKERMIRALKREPISGRVPHFELNFFLTMEKLGRVHPKQRRYDQWMQMSRRERRLHMEDIADLHIKVAECYQHDAIFIHPTVFNLESATELLEIIRERTGDQYLTMMHGDPTLAIPDGGNMMDFVFQMYDEPEKLHDQSKRDFDMRLRYAEALQGKGLLDCFCLCSDYAFNANPFFTVDQFEEFVFPYLRDITSEFHRMGYWVIKHTDGNLKPILDMIVEAGPDALHSIDPQGGMNLAEVRAQYGDRIATIGNVNCGLLQTGTQEQADADVRRCLHEGMDDGKYGFVFATSNCVYTGMPLERYERMVEIWQNEGIYEKRQSL